MLNATKHPHTGFLAGARNDRKRCSEWHQVCRAGQSVSEVKHPLSEFLAGARNEQEKVCGMIYGGSGYFGVI
jgi:hypothetical protein